MISPGNKLYFVGVGGVGMTSAAGLMKKYGCYIEGSDHHLFSPTKEMLCSLNVPVKTPYHVRNIMASDADLFVIGNSLSKNNPEVAYILENNLPYTSFTKLLEETILSDRQSVVVCGTHGKTTVSSLLTHCLFELKEKPSFFIGGLPVNFSHSFCLNKSPLVILEGDEYDTAFFDKGSKFLHYAPRFLILNNIEYDHVDIFPSFNHLLDAFRKLIRLVPEPSSIVANIDNDYVTQLLKEEGVFDRVYKVSVSGANKSNDLQVKKSNLCKTEKGDQFYSTIDFQSKTLGNFEIRSHLLGEHNVANISMVIGAMEVLSKACVLPTPKKNAVSSAVSSFKGVKKRLEYLGKVGSIPIYLDFAHHPTAVSTTISSVRQMYPNKRLIAAFEPKNASSRRNIFMGHFIDALKKADVVLLAPCAEDKRVPDEDRLNTKVMQNELGSQAFCFENKEAIKQWLVESLGENDVVLFMSCGTFLNIPYDICL